MKHEGLIVGGVVVSGIALLVWFTGKGVIDMFANMFGGGWKKYSEDLEKYYEDLVAQKDLAFTGESARYGDLYSWYQEAIDKINKLQEELSKKAYNTFDVRTGVIVSKGTGVDSIVEKMAQTTKKARENIENAVKDPTKTQEQVATVVKENINNVLAFVTPGWMPKGEV